MGRRRNGRPFARCPAMAIVWWPDAMRLAVFWSLPLVLGPWFAFNSGQPLERLGSAAGRKQASSVRCCRGRSPRPFRPASHGVSGPRRRAFRAADEGAAGQHRGDDGQAVHAGFFCVNVAGVFRRAVLTARLGAGEGPRRRLRRGGVALATNNPSSFARWRTQGPPAGFSQIASLRPAGWDGPDLPGRHRPSTWAQQIEAARRQEGGREGTVATTANPANGKGRFRYPAPPIGALQTMAIIPRFQARPTEKLFRLLQVVQTAPGNLPQRATADGRGGTLFNSLFAGHLCGENHKPGACLETPT